MKIVRLHNGYAIRRFFFGYEYLSNDEYYWWTTRNYGEKYCCYLTLEEAIKRLDSNNKLGPVSKKEIQEARLRINQGI